MGSVDRNRLHLTPETAMVSYMTNREFSQRFVELSAAQDRAAAMVLPALSKDLADVTRLCGGTALSRFYLKHRLSYDLDFFIPEGVGFDAQKLANQIASAARVSNLELTHDPVKAEQLHFVVLVDGVTPIKVSFVEDRYADVFPRVSSGLNVGGVQVATEPVEGLYHRKLRTVVGWADGGSDMPQGGRQTARDMFDLFALSQAVMPLRAFIQSLPDVFPVSAFENGLALMPWYDIAPELMETVAAPAWEAGKDVEALQGHLYRELGMEVVPPDASEEANEPDGPDEPRGSGAMFRRWRP